MIQLRDQRYFTGDTPTPRVDTPTGARGDLLVVALIVNDTLSATAADETPAGLTRSLRFTSQYLIHLRIFTRVVDGTEPGNYGWNFGGTNSVAVWAGTFSGVDTSDPVLAGVGDGATGTGSTAVAAGVTSVVGGLHLILGGAQRYDEADVGVQAWTPPAGYTERLDRGTNWVKPFVATRTLTADGATGPQTATFALGTFTNGWSAASIALRPAADTPPPVAEATPPTYVGGSVTGDFSTVGVTRSGQFAVAEGELVLVDARSWDNNDGADTFPGLPSGNNLAWTRVAEHRRTLYGSQTVWAAVATTTTTITITVSNNNDTTEQWDFIVTRWSGHDGIGRVVTDAGSASTPSLNVPTTGARSAIYYSNGDWSVKAGNRIYRTGAGTPTELLYRATTQNLAVMAYYPDAGQAGTKTVGQTAPAGQKWTATAIEILAAEPAGPTQRDVDATDTGVRTETVATGATATLPDTGSGTDVVATGSTFMAEDTAQARDSVAAGQLTDAPDSATADETTVTAGELTVPDERTATDTAGIEAELAVPTDTADHVESTLITLPVSDTGAGEATVATDADLGVIDERRGADAVTIETLFGDLVISIWAVDPDTGNLAALPDYTKLTMSPERNGPGSISLDYPRDGLNFGLLRRAITADRDLEVEIWNFGNSTGALRGYLQESSGDDVAEDASVWTFAGGFLELRMAEAIVFPQPLTGELTLGENVEVPRGSVTQAQWDRLVGLGYQVSPASENQPEKFTGVPQKVLDAVKANATSIPVLADPKRELKFDGVTVGELVHFILTQARARGALTDIATSFTTRADSQGIPWPTVVTTKYSPGATYESILNSLASQGRLEWSVSWTAGARTLNCYVPSGRGVDRTLGARPVVLRAGRNLAEAPRKWSVRNSATAMLGIGAEGFYADTSSLDAQTRRGRRIEDSTSSQNLATGDAVLAYAQRRLSTKRDGQLEVTHGLAMLPGEPRPLVAFDVGDWVYSQTSTSLDRYRVVQWTLSVDAQQQASATVTLNDAFLDAVSRQQKELDALVGGETVVGTSEDSNRVDTGVPSAPTGLVVGSMALMEGPDAYAVVTAGWAAVTTNTDGTAAADIDGYRVEWRRYLLSDPEDLDDPDTAPDPDMAGTWVGAGTTPTTQIQFTTATGLPILVRVQAYDRTGNRSTWTELSSPHTTESDTVPPGVPSTPTGGDYLGTVTLTWNGLTEDGADMALAHPDFSHVELHCSTTSMFTPDATTQIGQLYGRGTYTYADLPYGVTQFFRLVAVDVRGNASGPSGQGSSVPSPVVSDDVFDGAIGSAKLAEAAVTTAKINDLAVNDAKIGSLGVGKLTAGILNASMIMGSGAIIAGNQSSYHVRVDTAGVRLFGANGTTVVSQLLTSNGSAMISGEFRTTSASTARMVLNPGGAAPAEMRFYPTSTNQYASMGPVTSVATNFEGQAGIRMKGYSSRWDNMSGEVAVFPDYSSIAFGDERPGGSGIRGRVGLTEWDLFLGSSMVRLSTSYNPGPDGPGSGFRSGRVRFLITDRNSGETYHNSQLDYSGKGGDSWPRLVGFASDSGIQFDLRQVSMINYAGGLQLCAASAFSPPSSERLKTDITEVPFDPLATIKNACGHQYAMIHEKKIARTRGRRARRQVGLIAEHLPQDLRTTISHEDDEVEGVDLYGLVTTVWEGLRQLAERVDALDERGPKK